jgi:hypothetical protein
MEVQWRTNVVLSQQPTGVKPMLTINPVQRLTELLARFAIVEDTIEVGLDPNHFSDLVPRSVRNKLFMGHDQSGRLFVNLPLIIKGSDDFETRYKHVPPTGHDKDWHNSAVVLFQRWDGRLDTLSIAGEIHLMKIEKFVGNFYDNLVMLEKLLQSETLRFHSVTCHNKKEIDNPDFWIDVSLKR